MRLVIEDIERNGSGVRGESILEDITCTTS